MSFSCLRKYNKVIWSAKNGSAIRSATDDSASSALRSSVHYSSALLSLSKLSISYLFGIILLSSSTLLWGSQLEIVPRQTPKHHKIEHNKRERKLEKASVNWIYQAKCKLPKSVYNVALRVIKPCSAAAPWKTRQRKEWRKKIRIRWWCMAACQVLTCYSLPNPRMRESKHLTQLKEEACWWPIF